MTKPIIQSQTGGKKKKKKKQKPATQKLPLYMNAMPVPYKICYTNAIHGGSTSRYTIDEKKTKMRDKEK